MLSVTAAANDICIMQCDYRDDLILVHGGKDLLQKLLKRMLRR